MKIVKKTAIYLSFIVFTACTAKEIVSLPSREDLFPEGILINEILFNPKKEGVDFVELYNHSDHALDLRELALASIDKNKLISQIQPIPSAQKLLYPGDYLVLTTDPLTVQSHYPDASSGNFIRMDRLPAFNNGAGTVLLLQRKDGLGEAVSGSGWTTLDSLAYQAAMHSRFLKEVKGVSLERQSPDIGTNSPGNFRSAAMDTGGATPGYHNSNTAAEGTYIQPVYNALSPDANGWRVHYNIPHGGLMANILIYDQHARMVRHLVRHSSIRSRGVWVWDGLTDKEEPARVGIYTLVAELYNDRGFHLVYRKSFVSGPHN